MNYFKEMNEVENDDIENVINLNHNCLGTDLAELRMLQVILS
jgi:hypothetical protein